MPASLEVPRTELLVGDLELVRFDDPVQSGPTDAALLDTDAIDAKLTWSPSPGTYVQWRFVLPSDATTAFVLEIPDALRIWGTLVGPVEVKLRYLEASWLPSLQGIEDKLPLMLDGALSKRALAIGGSMRDFTQQLYPDHAIVSRMGMRLARCSSMPRKVATNVPGSERYRDERRKSGGPRMHGRAWHDHEKPTESEGELESARYRAIARGGIERGFRVSQARERKLHLEAGNLGDTLHQRLDHLEDTLLLRKRHLQVDLRELRLAVGAQIFVAKAARDLEIFVEASRPCSSCLKICGDCGSA